MVVYVFLHGSFFFLLTCVLASVEDRIKQLEMHRDQLDWAKQTKRMWITNPSLPAFIFLFITLKYFAVISNSLVLVRTETPFFLYIYLMFILHDRFLFSFSFFLFVVFFPLFSLAYFVRAETLLKLSPTSLKVTQELLFQGAGKTSLKDCLEMEFRVVQHLMV